MIALLVPIAVFLFLLFICSVFKPKYGLYLLVFIRPIIDNQALYITEKFPGLPFNYLQTVGVIVPVILLFSLMLKKLDAAKAKVLFFDQRIANYYALFLLACIPAVVLASETVLMIGDWLKYFTLWTILIYAINIIETPEDLKQLFVVIVISSFYPLLQFVIHQVTGDLVYDRGHLRNLGGYPHQNVASRTLLAFIPAYLFMIFRDQTSKKMKLIFLGLLMFLLLCIYMTYYRTLLLALATLLLSFAYFRKYYLTLMLLFLAGVMIILSSPYLLNKVVVQSGTVLLNFDELFNPRPTPYDSILAGRFATWRILTDHYLRHSTVIQMLFGFGFSLPTRAVEVSTAHNQFIQTIFRSGTIAALVFYFWLFKTMVFSLKNNTGLIPNVISAYIIGLLFATFAGDFFSDARTHWFLAPYLAIMIKYHQFALEKE